MMIYSRWAFYHFLSDSDFHAGVRSSCRIVRLPLCLTMTRFVMIQSSFSSFFRADVARATVPSIVCQTARG